MNELPSARAEEHERNAFLGRLAKHFAVRGKRPEDAPKTREGALPESLLEGAQVPGFEGVRVWGDVYTPSFEEQIVEKNHQVKVAAEAGLFPGADEKTSFLALSGGGDKGAFAAGVLTGWSERGDRPVFEVVTGVSAGALAAPFAFLGTSDDQSLHEIYTEYGAGQLYKSRGVRGFVMDALNDTSRLERLIQHYVTDEFLDRIAEEHRKGRRLQVLTTNLDAQRQVVWGLSGIALCKGAERRDLFASVLRASSALPGVFPPVSIDVRASDGKMYNELHVDGGVTAELVFIPPDSQLVHIDDMIFGKPRERTLYVVENGKLGSEYAAIDRKVLPLALRAVQTMVKYQVIDNLLALALVAKSNESRFYFNAIPHSFTPKPHALFDRESAKELFEVGRKVGLSGKWFTSPPSSPTLLPLEEADLGSGLPQSVGAEKFGRRAALRSAAAAGYEDVGRLGAKQMTKLDDR